VYLQTQRWLAAGCFEALADDLRAVLRLAAGRRAESSAAIIDSRTLRSQPASDERAGYDGGKRKKGSKVHMAVDTLGHLLALHVTPASAEDRGEVERLARTVQAVTDDAIERPRDEAGRHARCMLILASRRRLEGAHARDDLVDECPGVCRRP